jgi:hypothetical protein
MNLVANPGHITDIEVEAIAPSGSSGWVKVNYELEGFSEYNKIRDAVRNKVF